MIVSIAKALCILTAVFFLEAMARRSIMVASVLAAVPIATILASILLYWDTGSVEKVAHFTTSVFWLILPSLSFFTSFPWLLRRGFGFIVALLLAIAIMVLVYALYMLILRSWGIRI